MRRGFALFGGKKIRREFPPAGPAHHRSRCDHDDSMLSYMLQSRCCQKVMAALVENPSVALLSKLDAPSFHADPGNKNPIELDQITRSRGL